MGEHGDYKKYHKKSELDKTINSLSGLIEGIAIDSLINDREINFLKTWADGHHINADKHPFNEILPVLYQALTDGIVTQEEKDDILWLCKKVTSSEYFDAATRDMQRLHALLAGVTADKTILLSELTGIRSWLHEHEHLKKCWPYDEVESLIAAVTEDKMISAEEHKMLMGFFRQFLSIQDDKTIINPSFLKEGSISGVCAVCPDIKFSEAVFCVTGESHTYSRGEFGALIDKLGGFLSSTITQSVDYLIVCADGNPCWAYACYGRKVEKAIELRKKGSKIMIVHENDFHDAVADR